MSAPEFVPFPKIPRLVRGCTVTEKIDGTNAQVFITSEGQVFAGSRTRWITPEDDNAGFARWVREHETELLALGPGAHFGEWWGQGIQRRYGLTEKRFSLFNTNRWRDGREPRPACCGVVPVLYEGVFDQARVNGALVGLAALGSVAAPGFMRPEGIVVFHHATHSYFKQTIEKDSEPKGVTA